MRKLGFALSAALLATASGAQPQQPASPPKLLVVFSIDQFSADLFDEYRPQFTDGLIYIVMIAILLLRPQGLFGRSS